MICLSILRREVEMREKTFLIVIKVGRKNELRVLRSAKDAAEQYEYTDFDVFRLCCEDLIDAVVRVLDDCGSQRKD